MNPPHHSSFLILMFCPARTEQWFGGWSGLLESYESETTVRLPIIHDFRSDLAFEFTVGCRSEGSVVLGRMASRASFLTPL